MEDMRVACVPGSSRSKQGPRGLELSGCGAWQVARGIFGLLHFGFARVGLPGLRCGVAVLIREPPFGWATLAPARARGRPCPWAARLHNGLHAGLPFRSQIARCSPCFPKPMAMATRPLLDPDPTAR